VAVNAANACMYLYGHLYSTSNHPEASIGPTGLQVLCDRETSVW